LHITSLFYEVQFLLQYFLLIVGHVVRRKKKEKRMVGMRKEAHLFM
jgi:hypothetical protein